MTKSLYTRLGFLCLFLLSFRLLLPNVAPHITSGDAAELALSGSTLGVAHSPGYPVFSLTNKLGGELLAFGNKAYRQNVMSVVFLCLSILVLGFLLMLLTGQRWSLAIPLFLLFSGTFRHHAYVTEVFPLTVFWGLVLLASALYFRRLRAGLVLTAFLFGMGLAIHQTILLILPCLLYFLFQGRKVEWMRSPREWAILLGFFAIGLSIFLYLPARSTAQPVLDWEDPQTLGRFWGVVTRARYGFFQLAQGSAPTFSFSRLWDVLAYSKDFLIANVGWIGAFLLFVGSVQCLARPLYRRVLLSSWLLILFTGPLFFWFANASTKGGSDIFTRFTLLPLMGVMILMGLGVTLMWTSKVNLYRGFMVFLLMGFVVEGLVRNPFWFENRAISEFRFDHEGTGISMRWDLSVRESAKNMLRMVPMEASIFSDRADETEFSLAYLLGAEARRPHVRFVDCNAGVTKSIYGSDYYGIWGAPRLQRREKIEKDIVNTSAVPVLYATLEPTMIDIVRAPRGILYRAWPLKEMKEGDIFPWDKVVSWRFFPREPRGIGFYWANLNLLGQSLFEAQLAPAAVNAFGLAARAGGTHRYELMGYWYQVRGEFGKSLEYYQRALSVGHSSEALFSNLGALQLDSGRPDEAVIIYEQGLKRYKNSIQILYNLAVARWQRGEMDQVKLLVNRILSIDPKNSAALNLAARFK